MNEHYLKGYVYEILENNHDKALQEFLHIDDECYLDLLGSDYLDGYSLKNSLSAAETLLTKAYKIDPQYTRFSMARLYEAKHDYENAYKLYRQMIEDGRSLGKSCLSRFYKYGLGVKQDLQKSLQLSLEYEQENPDARGIMRRIARRYFDGIGVEQSYEKAFEVLEKAYEREKENGDRFDKICTVYYAYMLRYGLGCKANPAQAQAILKTLNNDNAAPMLVVWCDLYERYATLKGDDKTVLGCAIHAMETLQFCDFEFCKEKVEQAIAKLAQVDGGKYGYVAQLGLFYQVKSCNYDVAERMFSLGYKYGCRKCALYLANLYKDRGDFYCSDEYYGKALKLYEEVATKDSNATAWAKLGEMYQDGLGVEQSFAKAWEYYNKANAIDENAASYFIGNAYYNGYGVQVDYAKALEYLAKASEYEQSTCGELDDMPASCKYAYMHLSGVGGDKDVDKAIEILHKTPSYKVQHVLYMLEDSKK